ncbi:hypothetical protein B0H10DRAFT_2164198 [Mycena sp. CBHHK59/15]|nr:hypothetical protein B0H10DRAFT_2164198 [Mycena sp. CBHHK59/15]
MDPQISLPFPASGRLVLGPFPIHAREQQFLSPLSLSTVGVCLVKQPVLTASCSFGTIDLNRTWPSSYADNGRVAWTTARATATGDLKVSFPDIRWSALQATEGWAAVQHHAVLRTSITLYPPQESDASPPPRLLVQLIQGSYIAILSASGSEPRPPAEWHAGNIYAMERTLPRAVELPSAPSTISPTTYDVYVSGDYEIRLFGDPNGNTPSVTLEPTQDVICDFVDGYAFGNAAGVGVRSLGGWWNGLTVALLRPTRITPSQMRIIPMRISKFVVNLTLTSDTNEHPLTVTATLPIKHLPRWSPHNLFPVKGSYFYAQEMPTAFYAFPPLLENIKPEIPQPPILCLHGAGVDIISADFWMNALPKQQHSWLVTPSGRTPWGLDWHGPSAKDAWGSVDALVAILDANSMWHSRKLAADTPVVLMGHSNGGQGAVVPAAAYIKSQAYVPLSMSRSAHFIDPAVRAILESSLTPDDNDLFSSNLVDTPVLAIHGGDDDNVPVWHSREAVSVLQTWNADANVTFREDPKQLHWYSSVLKVRTSKLYFTRFLDDVLQSSAHRRSRSKSFTLTVAVPAESGSLHGWKIERLNVPGRLGRLTVEVLDDSQLHIVTSNVNRFSVLANAWQLNLLRRNGIITFESDGYKVWKIDSQETPIQPSARIQSFLSTTAPLLLAVLDASPREMSLALRIAHDLNAYHRLDAEIIVGSQALQDRLENSASDTGNILIIGDTTTPFLHKLLEKSETPFRMENSTLMLEGKPIDGPGLGILFLHPHPTNPIGQMLFLLSTDSAGLERAGRLFPIRTGVTVPDWLITSSRAEQTGAGGVIGAGVWGVGWSWNEPLSWLY